ncbi:MAG: hypothetical protein AMS18_15930 [Gemmatimonas sp. SG8_17]|nr:MAG: hypothetical protein AMS18_15930 [Gemmatimonas sp. SG8_17]
MRRFIAAALLSGFVGLLPNPQPADAQESKLVACLVDAIETCDDDFDANSEYMTAIRGWCYLIRGGICMGEG